MPGPSPSNVYTGVPTVESGGGGGTPEAVRANPDDFGGQVGQAEQRAGAVGEQVSDKVMDLATHYAQMATEAKANDIIANQYAPAAANLRANFDQLQGIDKIKGYDGYISSLQNTRSQIVQSATSPYEKELLGNYASRHIAQEIDGAKREQTTALTQYENDSHAQKLLADSQNAIDNYNDPAVVDATVSMMDGQIQKHGMDRGLPQDAIDQQKDQAKGTVAVGMVGRALAAGDAPTANSLYAKNQTLIPGDQQLQIEKTLHFENTRQNGQNAANALLQGKPVPEFVGQHPAQVRATVADTAAQMGVDQNAALTVLKIESADGANVGSRGTIGQTSTAKGGTLQEQAAEMCKQLKSATTTAATTLGRQPEPWESYAVYQQGAGGGSALLKAAQAAPVTRAVDVLAQVYDSPKDALNAVVKNGGNATMTSGQFLDFIKQKYQATQARAMCSLPDTSEKITDMADTQQVAQQTPALGSAIIAPHTTPGVAVQPGATPMQALTHFNDVYVNAVQRAQQIPNVAEREGVLRSLNERHKSYEMAATAWKQNFALKAQDLALDSTFTSTDQIPADMKAALADDPHMMSYLQGSADRNAARTSGLVSKEEKEYGPGFTKAVQGVWGHTVNSVEDVNALYANHEITLAGHKELVSQMQGKKTPDGEAEATLKKVFFENAKKQISMSDDGLHIPDPKGDERYLKFMSHALPAYEKGKAEGKTAGQLLDPDSSDYIGKTIPLYRPSPMEWATTGAGSVTPAATPAPALTPQQKLIQAYQQAKTPEEKLQLKRQAVKQGYIRDDEIRVPLAE